MVRVAVFTNCSEVTLFLNGIEIGKEEVFFHKAEFSVPFKEGILTAEGLCGESVVTDCVRTTSVPEKLCCEVVEGKTDRVINVWLEDSNNNMIPDADNTISILLNGAELIGSANGNPNADIGDKNTSVPLFFGKCQFIIRVRKGEKAEVEISSGGFETQKIII